MSIAILNEVYDEIRRLAIAGSSVAPGDFRLKKLIPALEQAGKKSPVFAKLAEGVNAVISSNEKTASVALLDIGTLINSIAYTQGETGVEGELAAVTSRDFGMSRTQTSAKLLKPLLEALTTTGSGRMEIIRDAHSQGLFRDLRLIRPTLLALDDPYGEIADFVSEKVLPLFGAAIYPELEKQFNHKGNSGDQRRLELMHRLDPTTTRPYVQDALEEGGKDMRVAAIGCLGTSEDDLNFLLEQAKTKAKDVRAAAYRALSRLSADQATDVLIQQIDKADLEIATSSLCESRNPRVLTALIEATRKAEKTVFEPEKDKKKVSANVSRLLSLLSCFNERNDNDTEKLIIDLLGRHSQFLKIKSDPGGSDVLEEVADLAREGNKSTQQALAKLHAELPASCMYHVFESAVFSLPAEEVFKTFTSYLTGYKGSGSGARSEAAAKAESIIESVDHEPRWHYSRFSGRTKSDESIASRLSPKWLDFGIDNRIERLILELAKPGDTKSQKAVMQLFDDKLAKTKNMYDISDYMEALIRVNHPDCTDAFIRAIKIKSKSIHEYEKIYFARFIPSLPKDIAVPKLEAIISELPEKVAESVLDQLVTLKLKPDEK